MMTIYIIHYIERMNQQGIIKMEQMMNEYTTNAAVNIKITRRKIENEELSDCESLQDVF